MPRFTHGRMIPLIALSSLLVGCTEQAAPTAGNTTPVATSTTTGGASDISSPPKDGQSSGDRLGNMVPVIAAPDIPQEPSVFRFEDITKAAGIGFSQVSGMTEARHFPSANGSGVAVFDYDGDGRMDLYFATGTYLPVGSKKSGSNRLYRNKGDGTFEDTTEAAGLGFEGFCHGIVAADLDNDGDQDVFLCNYGPNVLYINDGHGKFRDASKEAGIDRPGWSSSGAPIDYDNDGDLDLYISNYGDWDLKRDGDRVCSDDDGKRRLYCSPKEVRTVKHFFYRNDGASGGAPHFTDVYDQFLWDEDKKAFKPGRDDGHGFGIVTTDVDGDGKIDIYVANDMNPNFLFLNLGGGKFRDASEESGAAFDVNGNAQSGMGIDAEDVDGDGMPELFVTNFQNESNTLYQNLGKGIFQDVSSTFGIAADSMPWVKWGCLLGDFDNDGWPDSFVANGHVDDNRPNISYGEPPLLHRNISLGEGKDASRRFKIATRDVGPYFSSKHVARGAAFGDLNDDGKLDIVVCHKDGPPAVLRNDTPANGNHWIRLNLRGTKSNRDAIGAKIEVVCGDFKIHRQRKGGSSMESTNDPRVLIGVGPAAKVSKVVVHWPSGGPDSVLTDLATDKSYDVVEPEAK